MLLSEVNGMADTATVAILVSIVSAVSSLSSLSVAVLVYRRGVPRPKIEFYIPTKLHRRSWTDSINAELKVSTVEARTSMLAKCGAW